MRVLVQRSGKASVTVDEKVVGQIGKGFLVLVGVSDTDDKQMADKLVKKLVGLRIFEDENGKMNLGIEQVQGDMETFKKNIIETVTDELTDMGLELVSLNIQDITDSNGYYDNIAALDMEDKLDGRKELIAGINHNFVNTNHVTASD